MTDLRAPDPTLDLLVQAMGSHAFVYVVGESDPAVAHAYHNQCGVRDFLSLARDARWFAVPCRECFPDAPPPGCHFPNEPIEGIGVSEPIHAPGLSWQVEGATT